MTGTEVLEKSEILNGKQSYYFPLNTRTIARCFYSGVNNYLLTVEARRIENRNNFLSYENNCQ